MAFVFGKSRKVSSFQVATAAGPGPGQYAQDMQLIDERPAPFNSSTYKISSFEVDTIKPGPGSYDPTCPSSLLSDKKLMMTSSFVSRVDRFKTEPQKQISRSPQLILANASKPKIINLTNKTQNTKDSFRDMVKRAKIKMEALQSTNNQNRVSSISGNRDFVRIVLSNPKNTEVMQSIFVDSSFVLKEKGPGSYDVDTFYKNKQKKAIDWSKDKNSRFKQQKDRNPGPGYYIYDRRPVRSLSMSSAFAYGGLRSYMDEVIYKTKMPFKVKVIQEKKLKDRYPGPGQYDTQLKISKSFHYGEQSFGSFAQNQNKSYLNQGKMPGPGSYDVSNKVIQNRQELRKTRNQIFGKQKQHQEKVQTLEEHNKEEVRKQCIRQMERESNKFYSLEERCSSKIGTISHAQRFKVDNHQQSSIPGPGQYKPNIQSVEENYHKRIQYGFNSTASRCNNLNQSFDIPFYDIDRHDLGKQATRIKNHLQNLKQIDIEKAPFNCREKRAVFDMNKNEICQQKSNKNVSLNWNNQQSVKRQSNHKYKRNRKQAADNQQTSIFKSKTKREWATSQHQIGPGNYYNYESMEKKSFNKDYNYQAPSLRRKSTMSQSKRQLLA